MRRFGAGDQPDLVGYEQLSGRVSGFLQEERLPRGQRRGRDAVLVLVDVAAAEVEEHAARVVVRTERVVVHQLNGYLAHDDKKKKKKHTEPQKQEQQKQERSIKPQKNFVHTCTHAHVKRGNGSCLSPTPLFSEGHTRLHLAV